MVQVVMVEEVVIGGLMVEVSVMVGVEMVAVTVMGMVKIVVRLLMVEVLLKVPDDRLLVGKRSLHIPLV